MNATNFYGIFGFFQGLFFDMFVPYACEWQYIANPPIVYLPPLQVIERTVKRLLIKQIDENYFNMRKVIFGADFYLLKYACY